MSAKRVKRRLANKYKEAVVDWSGFAKGRRLFTKPLRERHQYFTFH